MVTTTNDCPPPQRQLRAVHVSPRDPDSNAPIVSARRYVDAPHIDLQTLASQASAPYRSWI